MQGLRRDDGGRLRGLLALRYAPGWHAAGQGFVPDHLPAPPTNMVKPRELACLRCQTPMQAVSRMRFHEGTRAWPFLLGELGELLVNRQAFDTYACTGCGKVEFFVTSTQTSEARR